MKQNIKKSLSILIFFWVISFFAVTVFAQMVGPTSVAPNNNVPLPINQSSVAQIKDGGVSVFNFMAAQNSSFQQSTFFNDIIRGATPSELNSQVFFGNANDNVPTNFDTSGILNIAGKIKSYSLKNNQNLYSPLCADNTGKINLCTATTVEHDYCANNDIFPGVQTTIPNQVIYIGNSTCKYKDSAVTITYDTECQTAPSWNSGSGLAVHVGNWLVGTPDQDRFGTGTYTLGLNFTNPPKQDIKLSLTVCSSSPGWYGVFFGYRTYNDEFSVCEGNPTLYTIAKSTIDSLISQGSYQTGRTPDQLISDYKSYLPKGIAQFSAPILQNGSGAFPTPMIINVPAGTTHITTPELYCDQVGGGDKIKRSYVTSIKYKIDSANPLADLNFVPTSPTLTFRAGPKGFKIEELK